MVYRVGIEDIEPNNWVVWVFDLPGCYARGRTREEALSGTAEAIASFLNWKAGYQQVSDTGTAAIETELVEEWHSPTLEDGYIVNAFFEDDRRPLTAAEADEVMWLLELSRRDLMQVLQPVRPEVLDRFIPGEFQKNIRGIVRHIAKAEWWYFDRFDLAPEWSVIPEDIFLALEVVRINSCKQLPRLVDNTTVRTVQGEKWSGRKIVRRMLWHERVHTRQIARYLGSDALSSP